MLSTQLDIEVFADLAEIAGIELVVVDAETQLRDFGRELRWSEAYFQLAGAR